MGTALRFHPSLVGGQTGRPLFAFRHFAATLTWAASSLLVFAGCAASLSLVAAGVLVLCARAGRALVLNLDGLHTPATALPYAHPTAGSGWTVAAGAGTAPVQELYTFLGLLGATSSHVHYQAETRAPRAQAQWSGVALGAASG